MTPQRQIMITHISLFFLIFLLLFVLYQIFNCSNDELKEKEGEILIQIQKGKEYDIAIENMLRFCWLLDSINWKMKYIYNREIFKKIKGGTE